MGSSSSTSSSEAGYEGVRPLPAWLVAAMVALAIVCADQGIRRSYRPQGDIRHRALTYARTAEPASEKDVLIFGSCLPEQMMNLGRLQQHLSVDYDVYQLGTASGTGLMWTVLLNNYIPDPSAVDAILVPFGKTDLVRRNVPWESHLMGLATWSDIPSIIELDCDSVDCAFEVILRKFSWLYRHRTYIGGLVWHSLGAGRLERSTHFPEYQRQWKTLRPEGEDPWRYLRRFLALAQERRVTVIFTPLPFRDQIAGQWSPPRTELEEMAERDRIIAEYDAFMLPFPTVRGLSTEHFEDDVHVGSEGRELITQALSETLPQWLQAIREGEIQPGDEGLAQKQLETLAPRPIGGGPPIGPDAQLRPVGPPLGPDGQPKTHAPPPQGDAKPRHDAVWGP